jgi:hypothetical protein
VTRGRDSGFRILASGCEIFQFPVAQLPSQPITNDRCYGRHDKIDEINEIHPHLHPLPSRGRKIKVGGFIGRKR